MAVNPDVFRTILALDSYNRGFLGGISLSGTQIGLASVSSQSPIDEDSDEYKSSFFAAAYEVAGIHGFGDIEKVVSYRGTDYAPTAMADIWYGWTVGAGFPATAQAQQAIDFYKSVVGSTDSRQAKIELVGHSLGGAGFIASLYGRNATVFDNMPFEDSVDAAYALSSSMLNLELRQKIYGSQTPWLPTLGSNTSGYAVSGEALTPIRSGANFQPEVIETGTLI